MENKNELQNLGNPILNQKMINQNVLEDMGLVLSCSQQDKFTIFDALSYFVYKNKNYSQKIKDICLNYVHECYEKQTFPNSIRFIKEIPEFLSIYAHKQHHQIFEGFNLNLTAHLLNRQICLLNFYKTNLLPIMSKFNFKGNPQIHLAVLQVKEKLYYFPLDVVQQKGPKDIKKKQKNIGKLKKYIEGKNLDIKWKEDLKDASDSLVNMTLNELFKNQMNSIGVFMKNFDQRKSKEDYMSKNLNEIKEVFSKYQLSVTKKNISYFKEKINEGLVLENLPGKTKKEIIFGEQTTIRFFKKRVKNQKKQKVIQFDDEKIQVKKNIIITNIDEKLYKGLITNFNLEKKFGFLKSDQLDSNVYFHMEDLIGDVKIEIGLEVSFNKVEYLHHQKLNEKAVNIRLVEQERIKEWEEKESVGSFEDDESEETEKPKKKRRRKKNTEKNKKVAFDFSQAQIEKKNVVTQKQDINFTQVTATIENEAFLEEKQEVKKALKTPTLDNKLSSDIQSMSKSKKRRMRRKRAKAQSQFKNFNQLEQITPISSKPENKVIRRQSFSQQKLQELEKALGVRKNEKSFQEKQKKIFQLKEKIIELREEKDERNKVEMLNEIENHFQGPRKNEQSYQERQKQIENLRKIIEEDDQKPKRKRRNRTTKKIQFIFNNGQIKQSRRQVQIRNDDE